MSIWRNDEDFINFFISKSLDYMQLEQARALLWQDAIGMTDQQIQELLSLVKSICWIVVEDYIKEKKAPKTNSATPQQTNLCLQ